MRKPAAKGRKLLSFAAILLAAAALAVPTAEASRYLPSTLAPSSAPPPIAAAAPEPGFDLLTAEDRLVLTACAAVGEDDAAQLLERRSYDLFSGVYPEKLASGASSSGFELNLLERKGVREESHRAAQIIRSLSLYDHRARFYDPGTLSFLEPDPLGPVDSPNLYQAFGFDAFNVTDPYGLSLRWYDWFGIAGDAWYSTQKSTVKLAGNAMTLGIAGRMTDEYRAGNVDTFGDSMRVAGDALTNTVTFGARDLLEGGATGGEVAREVSGIAGIDRGSEAMFEGIVSGDAEMALSGLGEMSGGVGQLAGWGAGAAAAGNRLASAASMNELTGAAQQGMRQFGREMGTVNRVAPNSGGGIPGIGMAAEAGRRPYRGVDYAESPGLYPVEEGQLNIVRIEYTGTRARDIGAANLKAGLGSSQKAPSGYVWHHLDDYDPITNTGTLQLVNRKAHRAMYPHRGGVVQYEEAWGIPYDLSDPVRANARAAGAYMPGL